jgi:hypothetical protein
VTIDYPQWRITIEGGALPEPNGRDVFALARALSENGLAVTIAGRTIPFRLDPLFTGGLLLPEAYVTLLPLVGQPIVVGSMTTASGEVTVREAQLAEDAKVGSFDLPRPIVRFSTIGNVAIVGGQWLRDFAVTYDRAHARARLDRRSGP